MASRREAAGLLALAETTTGPWSEVADAVEAAGTTSPLVAARRETVEAAGRWLAALDRLVAGDPELGIVTVLDDDYPANLAQVFDRPPFLFARGRLLPSDARSVAVVGTRQPCDAGRQTTRELAAGLARAGVTVVSGLARGLDTDAHTGALAAGGRTIAVLGRGIRCPYPPENADLALRIGRAGAVVSQFWPDAPPSRTSFPRRNVVTSGIALATLVVEASATSGARLQARLAREHGRPVFLVDSLVRREAWASALVEQGAA
ncbi:MAG TPA: DNA-processing protein DprA, partial [Acidimicrobiales bacterium]|nr:DNA-processing protein DprA [Acidimicrobiales bacterium]